jgi:hypothetical protein
VGPVRIVSIVVSCSESIGNSIEQPKDAEGGITSAFGHTLSFVIDVVPPPTVQSVGIPNERDAPGILTQAKVQVPDTDLSIL